MPNYTERTDAIRETLKAEQYRELHQEWLRHIRKEGPATNKAKWQMWRLSRCFGSEASYGRARAVTIKSKSLYS